MQEKFADTIGEIGSRKSKKDRQHNGQKTKGQTMIYKRLHRKQTIAKDEPHRQERLNSSIGPWEKQCNGTPTYTTSLVNKTINVDQIKHNLLYWYFQQNQCLCIKKHAMHDIHRSSWVLCSLTPGKLHSVSMR